MYFTVWRGSGVRTAAPGVGRRGLRMQTYMPRGSENAGAAVSTPAAKVCARTSGPQILLSSSSRGVHSFVPPRLPYSSDTVGTTQGELASTWCRLRAPYHLAAARGLASRRGHGARLPSRAARCTPAVFKFCVRDASVAGHGGKTACPECGEHVTVKKVAISRPPPGRALCIVPQASAVKTGKGTRPTCPRGGANPANSTKHRIPHLVNHLWETRLEMQGPVCRLVYSALAVGVALEMLHVCSSGECKTLHSTCSYNLARRALPVQYSPRVLFGCLGARPIPTIPGVSV
ncbi:hypothetical protein VTO73DRAFT_13125 [Trametes versicolor]